MKGVLLASLLYLIAQTIAWFQTNGLLISKTLANNVFLTSLICGPIVGVLFAYGTKFLYETTDAVWPARFLSFSLGWLVFIPLTWIFFDETPFTLKNMISIGLCIILISIQLFMK